MQGAIGLELLGLFPDSHLGGRPAREGESLFVLELENLVRVVSHLLLHHEDPLLQGVLRGLQDDWSHCVAFCE